MGKELVAKETAGALLCAAPESREHRDSCGVCASCRKVSGGDHPDLHWLAAKGASISVDDVRFLQESLSFQAFERGRKVVIIRDAFRMTREASNALLKTLEEPPPGTHLFLLAHHRNQLLPTLVSRCQALRFDPLSRGEVAQLLESRGVEPNVAERLAALSDGAPGAVMADDPLELVALAAEAEEAFAALAAPSATERLSFAARWSGDRERLGRRLDALERLLREKTSASATQRGVDDRSLGHLEAVMRTRTLLDQNMNLQLSLDALFLGLVVETLEGSL